MSPPSAFTTCSGCGGKLESLDASGELVCIECGMVLAGIALQDEHGAPPPCSTNRHLPEFVAVPKRPSSSKLVYRRIANNVGEPQERWRNFMRRLTSRNEWSAAYERAYFLLSQCLQKDGVPRPRELVCIVCLILALREIGQIVSLQEMATETNTCITALKRVYARVEPMLKGEGRPEKGPPNSQDPNRFIPEKMLKLHLTATKLNLPEMTLLLEQNARIVLMYAMRSGRVTGRRPDILAGAAIVFAIEARLGCSLESQIHELAVAMNLSGFTLKRCRREFRRALEEYMNTALHEECTGQASSAQATVSKTGRLSNARFAALLDTLLLRWRDVLRVDETTLPDSASSIAIIHKRGTVQTNIDKDVTGDIASCSLPSHVPIAAGHLVQLSTTQNTASSYAVPANEPPALFSQGMLDDAPPAFKRATSTPAPAQTSVVRTQLPHPLDSVELRQEDLSLEEERAYFRTAQEVAEWQALKARQAITGNERWTLPN